MFSRHRRNTRRGVTAIEYGILAALIIVAILAAVAATGTNLKAVFGQVGGTLENTVAPPLAYVFNGGFETVTSSAAGACIGSPISGFASSTAGDGILLTPYDCGASPQSTAYAYLTSNTAVGGGTAAVISNQSGHNMQITVPALQGAGTGFTIPAYAGASYVRLYKTQAGGVHSFYAYSPTKSFTPTNVGSMHAACHKEGGQLQYGPSYASCVYGGQYTGTEIATMLPPQ